MEEKQLNEESSEKGISDLLIFSSHDEPHRPHHQEEEDHHDEYAAAAPIASSKNAIDSDDYNSDQNMQEKNEDLLIFSSHDEPQRPHHQEEEEEDHDEYAAAAPIASSKNTIDSDDYNSDQNMQAKNEDLLIFSSHDEPLLHIDEEMVVESSKDKSIDEGGAADIVFDTFERTVFAIDVKFDSIKSSREKTAILLSSLSRYKSYDNIEVEPVERVNGVSIDQTIASIYEGYAYNIRDISSADKDEEVAIIWMISSVLCHIEILSFEKYFDLLDQRYFPAIYDF